MPEAAWHVQQPTNERIRAAKRTTAGMVVADSEPLDQVADQMGSSANAKLERY